MAIVEYKPTTPGRRGASVVKNDFVSTERPCKSLTVGFANKSGRAKGKISTRHKGGGAKRLYRIIDFGQSKIDIPAKVASIEYDPNRSAYIALLNYKDGGKRYILAPEGLRAKDEVITSANAPVETGNRLILKNIPVGTGIHNIEIIPGKGGQTVRTAGALAKVRAKEGGYVHVSFPSGEIRMIPELCWASVGQISKAEARMRVLGKAGKSRWLGKRPAVRGSAMNPVDHPHGGGEGRQSVGMKYPKTPWGKHALGKKTRNKKNISEKFIIKHKK